MLQVADILYIWNTTLIQTKLGVKVTQMSIKTANCKQNGVYQQRFYMFIQLYVVNLAPLLLVNVWAFWGCPIIMLMYVYQAYIQYLYLASLIEPNI